MYDTAETTQFLPARRLAQSQVLELAEAIARSPAATSLSLVPLAIVILNDTRQIVYANTRFAGLTDDASEALLGQRLGEALGCEHARETAGGCGTTRFCQYCGAAKAIVKGLEGVHATEECAISRNAPHGLASLNLQVWTTPLEIETNQLVLSSILDIAHEKALRGLERVFFHDIMNAVSGVKGVCDLIALELPPVHGKDITLLGRAIDSIQDIVETQRDFLAIEAKEYQQSFTRIESRNLLQYLQGYCQSFSSGRSKTLGIDPLAADVVFFSDLRILQRILVNMIKNALEASKPGDHVTLGCRREASDAIRLWVANPGVMTKETCMRLFEKGFSTKGQGRGFGTYSMRLFAQQCLGGDVSFESAPESGTRFFLLLPAAGIIK